MCPSKTFNKFLYIYEREREIFRVKELEKYSRAVLLCNHCNVQQFIDNKVLLETFPNFAAGAEFCVVQLDFLREQKRKP